MEWCSERLLRKEIKCSREVKKEGSQEQSCQYFEWAKVRKDLAEMPQQELN